MSWDDYLQQTKELKPRALLVKALEYVTHKDKALDLGAGALNEARFLVSEGFHVVAVDSNPNVAGQVTDKNIEVIISQFDEYEFPEETFDLISAQYALPFNSPDTFKEMFLRLKKILKSRRYIYRAILWGRRRMERRSQNDFSYYTAGRGTTLRFKNIRINRVKKYP